MQKRPKHEPADSYFYLSRNLSKIIKQCDDFSYEGYVQKRPKHEPTDSYFYLAIYIAECMMRSDAFNFHFDPVKTEMTGT